MISILNKLTIKILLNLTLFILINCFALAQVSLDIVYDPASPRQSLEETVNKFTSLPGLDLNIVYHQYNKQKFPDLDFLPAYFFSEEIENNARIFNVLTKSNVLCKTKKNFLGKGAYSLKRTAFNPSLYPNQTKIAGQLELFYTPFCPYGSGALLAILQKANKNNSPIKNLILTPIVKKEPRSFFRFGNYKLEEEFMMPGGRLELEETLRQLIIYKYWSNKLLPYLEAKKKQTKSKWQDIATQIGLNPKKIQDLIDKEGIKLLELASIKVENYKIKNSPTYFWQNQIQYNYTSEIMTNPLFKGLNLDSGNSYCGI